MNNSKEFIKSCKNSKEICKDKVKERLERMIYLADDRNVAAKFVNGKSVVSDKDGK